MSVTAKDYDNSFPNTWCPGCGNFGILAALKQALSELNIKPYETAIISGIGQSGKTPHYMRCNFFNGLHGRSIPVAEAVKIANADLPVIAVGGDGDMYGEGGNHFIHALRRNVNITMLVHNNKVFGLTQGQASPTTDQGVVTKVQKHGVFLTPFNPLAVAVALEAPFVARGYAGDQEHLVGLIKAAMEADGFSLVDILQPCVSFDRIHTFQWYKDRIYDVNQAGHEMSDLDAAVEKSREWGERIPIGIIYRNLERPSFESEHSVLKGGALIKRTHNASLVEKAIDSFL